MADNDLYVTPIPKDSIPSSSPEGTRHLHAPPWGEKRESHPMILVLGGLEQKEWLQYKAILDYILSRGQPELLRDPVLKEKKNPP